MPGDYIGCTTHRERNYQFDGLAGILLGKCHCYEEVHSREMRHVSVVTRISDSLTRGWAAMIKRGQTCVIAHTQLLNSCQLMRRPLSGLLPILMPTGVLFPLASVLMLLSELEGNCTTTAPTISAPVFLEATI
jgi:hypothetical protein